MSPNPMSKFLLNPRTGISQTSPLRVASSVVTSTETPALFNYGCFSSSWTKCADISISNFRDITEQRCVCHLCCVSITDWQERSASCVPQKRHSSHYLEHQGSRWRMERGRGEGWKGVVLLLNLSLVIKLLTLSLPTFHCKNEEGQRHGKRGEK